MVVKSHDLSEAVKTFIAATSWAISQKDTQNYPGWKKVDFWVKAVNTYVQLVFSAWDKSRDSTANWSRLEHL